MLKVPEPLVKHAVYLKTLSDVFLSDSLHEVMLKKSCQSNLPSFLDGVTGIHEEDEDVHIRLINSRKASDLKNPRLLQIAGTA